MKTSNLLFLIIFLPFFGFGQNPDLGRTYDNTFPERFNIDLNEMREHIYSGIPAELRQEQHPRASYRFADQSTISTHGYFESGDVYNDWESLEAYVNDILQKVTPKEYADEKYIHAYIVKDGSYNAFMIPSGMMFVHIGLFDLLESEAALASILAHELAHYHLKHSVTRYVKEEQGKFKPGFLMKNQYAHKNFSIGNELDADSLSMIWMTDAGYNLKGMIQSFESTERVEKSLITRQKNAWEIEETTHPRSEKRLKKIDTFIEENEVAGGKYFIVSKEKFKQFKEEAKPEILKYLLQNFEYSTCIEKAFKYHIFNPDNSDYVYYLMEAIRRKCYFDTSMWRKNFITERYYKTLETKRGVPYKERLDRHVFEEIPADILCLNEREAKNIGAKFYWEGEPKFKTYEQAFEFFNRVGGLHENPECVLSNALSVSFDKEMMNKLLEKYLTYDKINYREYAEALLNDEIKSVLPDEKLTALSNFIMRIRSGTEEISLMDNSKENEAYLLSLLDASAGHYDKRNLIYLPNWKHEQFDDYTILKELEYLSMTSFFAKGQKTELHLLDPRYWVTMRKLKVNEVEFVNCIYTDVRKVDKTLEGYKTLANTSFEDVLMETKRNRYLNIFISSVREIEGGVMKIRYYADEDKLGFKGNGQDQITGMIKDKFERRDIRAVEIDGQ